MPMRAGRGQHSPLAAFRGRHLDHHSFDRKVAHGIFGDGVEPTEEGKNTRCLACRVWWKVAIVVVLVAAIAALITNKQRGDNPPRTASPARGATTQSGRDQRLAAYGGAAKEENTYSPHTVLATVNGEEIRLAELESALREMPEQYRTVFKNDQPGLLEQLISRKLLLQKARSSGTEQGAGAQKPPKKGGNPPVHHEEETIKNFLEREVINRVEVSDADVRAFYEQHKDEMPAGRSYEELKPSLRPYVAREKQDKAVQAYLAKLREDATITRNQDWIEAQKASAADNPLDRALATGRPVVADFGRGKCIPCKMMKPILDDLKEEYAGRAEILIIEIDEYPAVTQRVSIRAIPTQIFYDAEGNEAYRHEGFMPRDAIVAELTEMGVK